MLQHFNSYHLRQCSKTPMIFLCCVTHGVKMLLPASVNWTLNWTWFGVIMVLIFLTLFACSLRTLYNWSPVLFVSFYSRALSGPWRLAWRAALWRWCISLPLATIWIGSVWYSVPVPDKLTASLLPARSPTKWPRHWGRYRWWHGFIVVSDIHSNILAP